jgi:hypothetical protein
MGTFIAAIVLTFNAAWGMNQEPYRFYPYAALFLAATAVPWLFTFRLSARTTQDFVHPAWKVTTRIVVVIALCATAPTTYQFAQDTRVTTLNISHTEETAYNQIASAAPKQGLLLTDTCIPRKGFRVITDEPTLDMNAGLARPKHYNEVRRVINEQVDGVLSSGEALHAAGVTSFLTMNYCNMIDTKTLEARFGAPIATVTPVNADACGMPRDTTYFLYATSGDKTTDTTKIPGYNREEPHAFRGVPAGLPAPKPGEICSFGLIY